MTPLIYTLDESDMRRAVRLGFLRTARANALRLLLVTMGLAVIITLGVALFDDAGPDRMMRIFLILAAFYLTLIVVLLPLIYLYVAPMRVRQMIRQMPSLSREQTLSWDDQSMTIVSSYGEWRLPFADMHRWAADDSMVIAYPADYLIHAFPRRLFPDAGTFAAFQTRFRAAGVVRL